MADYKKVVGMLGENLASFFEVAKKLLIDWSIDPKKLLHLFQNFRKDDLIGLISGTHEIKVKEKSLDVEKKFGPAIKEFEFTVPADYKHDSQLDTFAKKTKKLKTTHYFNDALTSANFAKATNKLEPGKTYKVKIFLILATVTSEDCMTFLGKHNAILVGGQGITLLQDQKADKFPVGKYTVSFDQKDALWTDSDGYRRLPDVNRDSGGDWKFRLGFFEGDWSDDRCLLCFCDL